MTKNRLFEFDKNYCHSEALAEESQSKGCFAYAQHDVIVIGTDEAGRGPGAGGVFASAVCFSELNSDLIKSLSSLNDSKKLSKKVREELYEIILNNSINSTVCVEVEEIERINILNASLKAMKLACENVIKENLQSRLGFPAQQQNILATVGRDCYPNSIQTNILVLVDGNKLIKDFAPQSAPSPQPSPRCGEGGNSLPSQSFNFSPTIHQKCVIKGDSKSASIAAASILAKVTRDRYMQELHEKFPQYNWIKNAGYLTKEHLDAIDKYGVTPYHRKSFLRKHEARQLTLLNNA